MDIETSLEYLVTSLVYDQARGLRSAAHTELCKNLGRTVPWDEVPPVATFLAEAARVMAARRVEVMAMLAP